MAEQQRPSRKRRRREEIEEIVAAYRRSGQTQREFAASRGVPLGTLVGWLRRARSGRVSGRAEFVEVCAPVGAAAHHYELEFVREASGAPRVGALRVAGGFDAGDLRRLLDVLGLHEPGDVDL